MDRSDFDMGPGTSPPVQRELAEEIRIYQNAWLDVQLALNAVNNKADALTGPNVVHTEFTGPIVPTSAVAMDMLGPSVVTVPHQSSSNVQPIDPSQNPTRHNWGLGNERGRLALTSISPQSLVEDAPNLASPPSLTLGTGPNFEGTLWRSRPSSFENFNSLGIFNDCHPQQPSLDPATFLPTLSHPYPLPATTPVPFVYPGSVWVAPTPPPLVETVPLPPTTPNTCAHVHWVCGVVNNDAANDIRFPDAHAEERTSTPVLQTSGLSTKVIAVEPEGTLDDVESEPPSPVASSSGGGYSRARNKEERFLLFEEIRETLGINWTHDELLSLRTIITRLKGQVPDVEGGRYYKKRAVRAYFKKLQDIVGPHADKISYNKVLGNVLTNIAAQVDAPPQDNGKLYGVFRLNNW